MEELNQAKKLIESAQNILVLLSRNAGIDDFGSALSLSYTLNKTGKIVNLLPKKIPESYLGLFPQKFVPKNFVISIQGKEVSELYYEKENQALKIYLTLRDGDIEQEDIHFTSLEKASEQESDLLVTVGIDRLERLGDFYEKNFRLFYQTPILNIDNQLLNNKFGNVNLVSDSLPNTIISSNLIKVLNQNSVDENVRVWLLAGIIEFSQSKGLNREALDNVFSLIETGLNFHKIVEFFSEAKNPSQAGLLETTLKKLRVDNEKQLSFACLTRDDFKKANASPRDLGFVLEQLTKKIFRLPAFLLLWESNLASSYVRGVFYSWDKGLTQKILNQFEGQIKGQGIIFDIKEAGIARAHQKILEII